MLDSWRASIELGFERQQSRSVLARRVHEGPLRVQKPLYPEGDGVCQVIVLHPPAGIAGGDELAVRVRVGAGAHAQLSTPGATRWYRSDGRHGRQDVALDVAAGGVLEWLPMENIVFDGALADMSTRVRLHGDAVFVGAEVLCLGRRAAGEAFGSGRLRLATRIDLDDAPVFVERGELAGGAPVLRSAAGLGGRTVAATLVVAAAKLAPDWIAPWRDIEPREPGALHGVTALPNVLVGRCLGHSAEAARAWIFALWSAARPRLCGRDAVCPRIWNT